MGNERIQLIARLKRRHNIGRVLESIGLMLCALVAGTIAFQFTAVHHWDTKGRSLVLSGALIGVLVAWLVLRKIFATLPVHPYDHEFEELADYILKHTPDPHGKA